MTSVYETVAAPATADDPPAPGARRWTPGDRLRGVLVSAGVSVTVAMLAAVPLIRNRTFYYTDDSASQLVPMWYHLGTLIRAGHWPVLMDVNSWMGGNLSVETLFGVLNPVNALSEVAVSLLPDLVVAATLLKAAFMAFLALGCYLVAREYAAPRWAAAPVAVALPFAGFTLYFEAGVWVGGLIAFSWVPHVWWSAHRAARGRLNPLWAFVIGALGVTVGNPYGMLGIIVVLVGLLVEFAVLRDRTAVRRLLLTAVCIGLVAPLVYLPLLGTSSVTWRTDRTTVYNGQLAPRLGDLLDLSMPTYLPYMNVFSDGANTREPLTYLAWFVVPLLPWLDWRALRGRLRALSGPLVITGLFFALALGPSHLWMFRWPLRIVECGYLGVAVLFAAALSAGLTRTRRLRRTSASGLLLLAGAYLAWGTRPDLVGYHAAALGVVALLTAAAVRVARGSRRGLAAVLTGGTALTLLLQTLLIPANRNVTQFALPHNVTQLKAKTAAYRGETMQLARGINVREAQPGRYLYFLPGNAYLPAGVQTVNAYTGMGFQPFSDFFCLGYLGQTMCRLSFTRLWQPTDLGGRAMADLLRLKTVVVDNSLPFHRPVAARPGWHVQTQNRLATVLVRDGRATAWPGGRLSYASDGIQVASDRGAGRRETVRFRTIGTGGTLAFARLNWPGYTARVDGRPVAVRDGPAGLVTVQLPSGITRGTLRLEWTPPGLRVGAASALLGLLGALVLGGLTAWRPRRRRPAK